MYTQTEQVHIEHSSLNAQLNPTSTCTVLEIVWCWKIKLWRLGDSNYLSYICCSDGREDVYLLPPCTGLLSTVKKHCWHIWIVPKQPSGFPFLATLEYPSCLEDDLISSGCYCCQIKFQCHKHCWKEIWEHSSPCIASPGECGTGVRVLCNGNVWNCLRDHKTCDCQSTSFVMTSYASHMKSWEQYFWRSMAKRNLDI